MTLSGAGGVPQRDWVPCCVVGLPKAPSLGHPLLLSGPRGGDLSHVPAEVTEAQTSEVTCPRPHSVHTECSQLRHPEERTLTVTWAKCPVPRPLREDVQVHSADASPGPGHL